MTIREMLSLSQIELGQDEKTRYKTGTTTSNGAADGTTLVANALGGVDDGFNEAEVRITSGNALEERRLIGDYVASTGTITVLERFSHQILSAVTFEVGEAGFVSDHQLLKWFTTAQDVLINLLVSDALPNKTKEFQVAATVGLSAAMPTDLVGAPISVAFKDSAGAIYDVTVIPSSQQDRFRESVIQGQSLDDMIAVFKNGVIEYRPNNNGTLLLEGAQKLANVTFAGGSQLPDYLHHLQVKYAVIQGWNVKERSELAQIVQNEFNSEVSAINSKYVNKTKKREK